MKRNDSFWSRARKSIVEINPVHFSGCSDIIVVEDKEKNLKCTNFEIRIGKFQILKPEKTQLELFVNGVKIKKKMILSKEGIGFFKEEEDFENTTNNIKNNLYSSRRYTNIDIGLKQFDFKNINIKKKKNNNLEKSFTKLQDFNNNYSNGNNDQDFNMMNGSSRTIKKFKKKENYGSSRNLKLPIKNNFNNTRETLNVDLKRENYGSSRNLHLPIKNNSNNTRETLNIDFFAKKKLKEKKKIKKLFLLHCDIFSHLFLSLAFD